TTKLGEDLSSPYTYTWNNIPAGSHSIKVIATSSTGETGQASITINAHKAVFQSSAPIVDGTIDALWSNYAPASISTLIQGSVSSPSDLSATWKAVWTTTDLYVLVQVTDDQKRNDGNNNVFDDDGIEIYVDI